MRRLERDDTMAPNGPPRTAAQQAAPRRTPRHARRRGGPIPRDEQGRPDEPVGARLPSRPRGAALIPARRGRFRPGPTGRDRPRAASQPRRGRRGVTHPTAVEPRHAPGPGTQVGPRPRGLKRPTHWHSDRDSAEPSRAAVPSTRFRGTAPSAPRPARLPQAAAASPAGAAPPLPPAARRQPPADGRPPTSPVSGQIEAKSCRGLRTVFEPKSAITPRHDSAHK